MILEFPEGKFYKCLRWLYDHMIGNISLLFWSRFARIYFKLGFLRTITHAVTPSGRGLSKPLNFRRLVQRGLIKNQDILLIGVGNGKEIHDWLHYKPRSISAVELNDYRIHWNSFQTNKLSQFVPIHFIQTDGAALPFKDDSFDFASSFTVMEHITSLEMHIKEVYRTLRSEGHYYAVFGPLWPTYGGTHIGSLEYKHLLLNNEEILQLAATSTDGEKEWLEKGLFNRLRYDDYNDLFRKYFSVITEAWVLSRDGLHFRKKSPFIWNMLRQRYSEKDLLLKTVYVLLKKS